MILKQKPKKSSTRILVLSMICAAIITIMAQSLNHQQMQYNKHQPFHSSQFSTALGSINELITQQRGYIDVVLAQWFYKTNEGSEVYASRQQDIHIQSDTGSSIDNTFSLFIDGEDQQKDYHTVAPEKNTNIQSEFLSFDVLRSQLLTKKCLYDLPIDATDLAVNHIVQWSLDHCLITVSAARKVYPNDYLTHEAMRVIADRAGFVVKMDFASSQIVSRSQLYQFMYTLQQRHTIGDLPVVTFDRQVTRIQFLKLLYTLFHQDRDLVTSPNIYTPPLGDRAVHSAVEVGSSNLQIGQQTTVAQNDNTSIQEDTNTSPVSDADLPNHLIKQTLLWLVEKI